jgi:hypothetical protein
LGVVILTLLVPTLLVLACVSPGSPGMRTASPTPSPGRSATTPAASPSVAPTQSGGSPDPAPSEQAPEAPPEARLTSGGVTVAGAVGTFTWDGVVSDSPWLPGSDVRAGPGETLRIDLAGASPLRWSALIAPGGSRGVGAADAGSGAASPTLKAPTSRGTWELAVKAIFAAGEVRYHWRLTVQ